MFIQPSGILIELLAAGQYEVEKGWFVSFDAHDLHRMAEVYNKQKATRRAPLIIGHEEKGTDAKAWIDGLRLIDSVLFGYVNGFTSETFIAAINDKTYQRYQASFWGPEHPDNPQPGSWMLKHVGVMGPPFAEVRGPLVSEAAFMERVKIWEPIGSVGQKLRPELRFSTGGCIEFAEFPIVPADSLALAQRARAIMVFLNERGEQISATQAVAFASAGFSAAGHASALRQADHRAT